MAAYVEQASRFTAKPQVFTVWFRKCPNVYKVECLKFCLHRVFTVWFRKCPKVYKVECLKFCLHSCQDDEEIGKCYKRCMGKCKRGRLQPQSII